MEYDYGFEYAFPDAMEGVAEGAFVGAAGVVTAVLLILWLLAMGFAVACYVLNAVGMYRIAKRRGIHHAWLAWVPVGCNWLLGSISDHYQYVTKHKVTKRRKILLTLSLILLVVLGMFAAGVVAVTLTAGSTSGSMAASVLSVALIACSYLGMLGLEIAILVFCYIAYYDLFKSCKPENAVMFLVLGVFFNVALAFFVFFGCSQDLGMPAKRAAQPVAEEQPQWTEPQEEEIPTVEAEVVEDPEE